MKLTWWRDMSPELKELLEGKDYAAGTRALKTAFGVDISDDAAVAIGEQLEIPCFMNALPPIKKLSPGRPSIWLKLLQIGNVRTDFPEFVITILEMWLEELRRASSLPTKVLASNLVTNNPIIEGQFNPFWLPLNIDKIPIEFIPTELWRATKTNRT